MMRLLKILGVAAALSLASCASVQRLDAASDVHALLLSIRDGDQAAFDAHVDRLALQREIQGRMMAKAGKDRTARGVAAVFGPALSRLAGDFLIQPEVFRLVAEHYGYDRRTRIPPPVALAQALKPLPDGRVCATRGKNGPCL